MTRNFERLTDQDRPSYEQRQSSDVHATEALVCEERHEINSSFQRGASDKFVSSRTHVGQHPYSMVLQYGKCVPLMVLQYRKRTVSVRGTHHILSQL